MDFREPARVDFPWRHLQAASENHIGQPATARGVRAPGRVLIPGPREPMHGYFWLGPKPTEGRERCGGKSRPATRECRHGVRNFLGFIGNRCLAEAAGRALPQASVRASSSSPCPSASLAPPPPQAPPDYYLRGGLWLTGNWGC